MGHLNFLPDWSHQQDGEIRPGEPLSIDYAIERLTQCRGSRYGQDAWNIVACMRFYPGGEEKEGSVVTRSAQGTMAPRSLTVDVPTNATRVELWFKNTDYTYGECVAWDSRYGQNYRFNFIPPTE